MRSESETNIQCHQCGTIFQVDARVDSVEEIYIYAHCPCCEREGNMLNVGSDILDKYLYYDPVADERYYRY